MEKISLRKILGESWRHYKENFFPIIIICALIYLPTNIIEQSSVAFLKEKGNFGLTAILAIRLVLMVGGLIATLAVTIIASQSISGAKIGYKEALSKSIRRWWPSAVYTDILMGVLLAALMFLAAMPWALYFGYHLAVLGESYEEIADLADLPVKDMTASLILVGASFILLIPLITYAIYWLFSLYAVALNNKSGKAALEYSKQLVKGRWWRTLFYNMTLFILVGVIASPVFFISILPDLTTNALAVIISRLLLVIIFSYYTVALTVFYRRIEEIKK